MINIDYCIVCGSINSDWCYDCPFYKDSFIYINENLISILDIVS
jgi:hypothetical protein